QGEDGVRDDLVTGVQTCALPICPWIPIVGLTKGLEPVTHRRMTEVVDEVAPGHPAGVLTGPNIAVEVLRGYAAAAVIAMPDEHRLEGRRVGKERSSCGLVYQ